MDERKGVVTMKGEAVTLVGKEVKEGDKAPRFKALNIDLSEFDFAKECKGKVCVIAPVPSLDTSVCNVEARHFDQEAGQLQGKGEIVIVSMDLPFAIKRWREWAGVNTIKTLSDHRDAQVGKKFGVLMKELRLLARSVFVVDAKGVIRYRELVPEQGHEPAYDRAFEVARSLL